MWEEKPHIIYSEGEKCPRDHVRDWKPNPHVASDRSGIWTWVHKGEKQGK